MARKSFVQFLAAWLFAAPTATVAQPATDDAARGKRAGGTVVTMESGDTACIITLKDERGVTFREPAEFEICEQYAKLRGKRVTLGYRFAQLMAAACQGNPDCRKTERRAIVASATLVYDKALFGHCAPNEDVLFHCATPAKVVSLCASPKVGASAGTVQYRFGPLDKPELLLPDPPRLPALFATGESVPFAGGGGAWLRLKQGEHAYVLYSGIGKWGPRGETMEKAGVVVEKAGKRIAHVKCRSKAEGELGPDLFAKAGITARGEVFDFPD